MFYPFSNLFMTSINRLLIILSVCSGRAGKHSSVRQMWGLSIYKAQQHGWLKCNNGKHKRQTQTKMSEWNYGYQWSCRFHSSGPCSHSSSSFPLCRSPWQPSQYDSPAEKKTGRQVHLYLAYSQISCLHRERKCHGAFNLHLSSIHREVKWEELLADSNIRPTNNLT